MLTPRFKLEQTDDHLIVTIYAPFTNIADTEIFFDDLDFRFYSKPYFLRLHLPNPVEETDDSAAHFDAESLSYVVTVPKKTKGQFFPGLEMLTDLLMPKGNDTVQPLIEDVDEDEIDCYFDQQIPEESEEGAGFGYGFGFKQSGVFDKLLEECQHVFEIQGLDGKSYKDRRQERLENEKLAFSSDHYLADLHEPPDQLEECLRSVINHSEDMTTEEQDRMISLGKKKRVVLSKTEEMSACFGMLDILYAYCYENRVNEELSPESGWTIQKLASTLSCGEKFVNLKQVVVASMRRTLCYPLFRHYDLGLKVWQDVVDLLPFPAKIVKIFLKLIPLFIDENYGHLFNQLYIESFTVWAQTLKPDRLKDLQEALNHTLKDLKKSDLELELDELEFAANLTIEENASKELSSQLNDLKIAPEQDSDDDSSSEDSSEDSSSSSSDSSDSEDSDESDKVDIEAAKQ